MSCIILVGGGSGGHIIPNIALLPYLKKHFEKIYYVGENNSMEENIAQKYNIDFFAINAIKLDRVHKFKNLKIPFVLPKYINQAKNLIKKLNPDVVFSKGGYVSLPITLACKNLGVPFVIHESDKSLGMANKLVANNANIVITSNAKCNKKNNYITLGTPIRDEIFTGNPLKITTKFKITNNNPNILIVGGSLGATAINTCIKNSLSELTRCYNVIHITGKGKGSQIKMDNYYQIDYADNIADYYAFADIVIARSGAGIITELDALKKKSILIPLPKSASRGDQIENAKSSGLYYLSQENLTTKNLINAIKKVLSSPPPQSHYDKNTSQKIVQQILIASKAKII